MLLSGLAGRFKFQRLFIEVMGDQDQVTAVGLGKTRPCSIVTGIVYRKERKLPVRAANGYRKALIAHAVFSRDLGKFARGLAGPVQPLPVHRMEPLIAALNNRIDAHCDIHLKVVNNSSMQP